MKLVSLKHEQQLKNNHQLEKEPEYRVVAVYDNYKESGQTHIRLLITNTGATFTKPVEELYQSEWLNQLSREDVAHVAVLYTADKYQHPEISVLFPSKNPAQSRNIVIIGVLFSACLILSNLTAAKLITLFGFTLPAALVFFPILYLFNNVATEVYGFQISRRIIWLGLFSNAFVFAGVYLIIHLPSSIFWASQEAYVTVFTASFRILLASSSAYLVGEFLNSVILSKLKILTQGRYLWFRVLASTSIGVSIDSALFIHIAFMGLVPYEQIWLMILVQYIFKVGYEILALPLTYRICRYLKVKEKIDHYDYKTFFNPFSFKVD